MGAKGSGPVPHQDWALLLAQYVADYEPHKIGLTEFCREKGLVVKTASAAFQRERTRAALAVMHDRNKPLLLGAQRMVMMALIDSKNWPNKFQAAMFALKVYEVVAEREEPNPLLTLNQNVAMPPLFPNSGLAAKAIEALTAAEVAKPIRAERTQEAR